MTGDRLRRALARQARARRSRDFAWILFAAFSCVALFGWWTAAAHLTAVPVRWLSVVIYGGIALLTTALAVRLFIGARALNRRAVQAELISSADEDVEPPASVWSEVFPRRRRRD